LTTISRQRSARARPSETAATLREINVAPVKSLGQNFLHDRNLSRWIVDQVDPQAGDYIVEIGPGLGALTEPLLAAGAHVLALEKDRRLADYLRSRFANNRLEVRHIDALDFDVPTLFAKSRVKLIGNLPYYIASQLLIRFLEYPSPISLAVLMNSRKRCITILLVSAVIVVSAPIFFPDPSHCLVNHLHLFFIHPAAVHSDCGEGVVDLTHILGG